MINRRQFLQALFVAPAIIKLSPVMALYVPPEKKIITDPWIIDEQGNIRYVGAEEATYKVGDLYRFLRDQNILRPGQENPTYRDLSLVDLDGQRMADRKTIEHLYDGTLVQVENGQQAIYTSTNSIGCGQDID